MYDLNQQISACRSVINIVCRPNATYAKRVFAKYLNGEAPIEKRDAPEGRISTARSVGLLTGALAWLKALPCMLQSIGEMDADSRLWKTSHDIEGRTLSRQLREIIRVNSQAPVS